MKSILLTQTNGWLFQQMYVSTQLMTMWQFVQPILRFNIKPVQNLVCCPPQTNSDKDVQFEDSSRWGNHRAIAASTVLPLLSVAADRWRNCIDKLPWMNALKRSRTQLVVKITFSLMANLKQGTIDMCKSTAGRFVRSVDQELGDFHFGCVFLPHSWLACADAVADISNSANMAEGGLGRSS